MVNLPLFQPDPKIKSTFPERLHVVLTQNYSEAPHNFSRKFKKDQVCSVIQCGLTEYVYDEVDEKFKERPDSAEWCEVELSCMDPKPSQCCVKAQDLRRLMAEEYKDFLGNAIRSQSEINEIEFFNEIEF